MDPFKTIEQQGNRSTRPKECFEVYLVSPPSCIHGSRLSSLHKRGCPEAHRCPNRQIAKVHHIAKGGFALKGRWVFLVSYTSVYPAQDQQLRKGWPSEAKDNQERRMMTSAIHSIAEAWLGLQQRKLPKLRGGSWSTTPDFGA
jgi:hypothetical protein